MDYVRAQSQDKVEDQIPLKEKDDERVPSINENGKDWILESKTPVDNKKLSKEQYPAAYIFDNIDCVTLSTKKSYKVAVRSRLSASRRNSINCVFDTGTGCRVLRKDYFEPDGLSSTHPCDSRQLKGGPLDDSKSLKQSCYTLKLKKVTYAKCLDWSEA